MVFYTALVPAILICNFVQVPQVVPTTDELPSVLSAGPVCCDASVTAVFLRRSPVVSYFASSISMFPRGLLLYELHQCQIQGKQAPIHNELQVHVIDDGQEAWEQENDNYGRSVEILIVTLSLVQPMMKTPPPSTAKKRSPWYPKNHL